MWFIVEFKASGYFSPYPVIPFLTSTDDGFTSAAFEVSNVIYALTKQRRVLKLKHLLYIYQGVTSDFCQSSADKRNYHEHNCTHDGMIRMKMVTQTCVTIFIKVHKVGNVTVDKIAFKYTDRPGSEKSILLIYNWKATWCT
jgi:hypothetical protein